jgi:hypothetical protein
MIGGRKIDRRQKMAMEATQVRVQGEGKGRREAAFPLWFRQFAAERLDPSFA